MNSFVRLRISLSFLAFLTTISCFGQRDSIEYTVPTFSETVINCIEPPAGFDTTSLFNGYLNHNTSSSILISEVKGTNYISLKSGMTPEYFKSQNLVFISEEPFVSQTGIKGILYKASFIIKEIEMTRYMLFAGNQAKTIWVNVTYPTQFTELLDEEIRNSMNTLSLKY